MGAFETMMKKNVCWALLIYFILLLLFIRIAATVYALILVFFVLSLVSVVICHQRFYRKQSLWILPKAVLVIIIPVLSLQAAVPIFAPIIDLSIGTTTYGFIYENYTSTWREFNIDVHPPLFLTNIDDLNCRTYDIVRAKQGQQDAVLEPLTIMNLTNQDPDLKYFYRTLKICWNSNAKIDAWKLGKLSTSVHLESIQPVNVHTFGMLSEMPGEKGGDNSNYLASQLNIDNNRTYYAPITLSNNEYFPVRFFTKLWIKNDSQAYNSLKEMVAEKNCNRFVAYSVPSDNTSNIIASTDKMILGNNSINLGATSWFLNIDHLEPRETKGYQIKFECK